MASPLCASASSCFRSSAPVTARHTSASTSISPRLHNIGLPALPECFRPRVSTCLAQQRAFSVSGRRYQSSTSTTATSQQQKDQAVPDNILTWNRFFDLRRRRRFLNLGASGLTALTTVSLSAPFIATSDLDKIFANALGMPLDPFVVLGVTTIAVGGIGWMAGPTLGNGAFSLWAQRKGWKAEIGKKEKSFFQRIKRYRADPAGSSLQNPIPDYYGEKIKSVSDYRRWLKDQRVFARKASKNMI